MYSVTSTVQRICKIVATSQNILSNFVGDVHNSKLHPHSVRRRTVGGSLPLPKLASHCWLLVNGPHLAALFQSAVAETGS